MENVKKLKGDKMGFAKDEYEALKGADALIIATEWALFRTPDFKRVEGALKEKMIFDGRNLYDLEEMKELGFHYISVGRTAVNVPDKATA
jgi:UDPglucose 6-dehydrogenase